MNQTISVRSEASPRTSHWRLLATVLPVLALGVSGCQLSTLPTRTVAAVVPGARPAGPDPAVLQAELQRYAEDFMGRTAAALDEYAQRVGTPQGQTEALTWKLALNSSALSIATGPNPNANLLDFLALSTLTRTYLEQRASQAVPPGAFDPWLEASGMLETNAWTLADGVLKPEHQAQFRAALDQWCAQHREAGGTFFARPLDISMGIKTRTEKETQPGSVFSLVGLDPTAGLDPAVREVTRTRLFAERALFAVEQMPFLLRWQAELLSDQVLRQEQITNALASADRLSRAVESVSQTAAGLPDRISAERKAILDALEAQEGRLRALSAEVGHTLDSGEKMSTSLNTTITTFDGLMKRFGVGEPSSTPPDTNSPPFNILDYARTAEQIAAMAQQLDALIKDASGTVETPALDKRIADLQRVSDHARADAKSVLNHAFLLAAGLIGLTFGCALAYRWLTPSARRQPQTAEKS